jgi:hypothetical protein
MAETIFCASEGWLRPTSRAEKKKSMMAAKETKRRAWPR